MATRPARRIALPLATLFWLTACAVEPTTVTLNQDEAYKDPNLFDVQITELKLDKDHLASQGYVGASQRFFTKLIVETSRHRNIERSDQTGRWETYWKPEIDPVDSSKLMMPIASGTLVTNDSLYATSDLRVELWADEYDDELIDVCHIHLADPFEGSLPTARTTKYWPITSTECERRSDDPIVDPSNPDHPIHSVTLKFAPHPLATTYSVTLAEVHLDYDFDPGDFVFPDGSPDVLVSITYGEATPKPVPEFGGWDKETNFEFVERAEPDNVTATPIFVESWEDDSNPDDFIFDCGFDLDPIDLAIGTATIYADEMRAVDQEHGDGVVDPMSLNDCDDRSKSRYLNSLVLKFTATP